MPLLKLETTVPLSEEKGKPLLAALSKAVASATGKPEQYVMVTVTQSAMLMSGKAGEGLLLIVVMAAAVLVGVLTATSSRTPLTSEAKDAASIMQI